MGPFDTLLARVERGVLHLTLNQPTSRNAMSLRMVAELRAALAQAESTAGPQRLRVVVLRGAGGTFCSGGDLKDMAAARLTPATGEADPLVTISRAFGELCAAFSRTPLATVAVLEGAVMGGGFGLACAVDVALASDTVKLRLPEVERGIVPAQIAPFLVERLGSSQARRLALTAASVDAAEALRLGLCDAVVPHDELRAKVMAVAGRIAKNAPLAVAEVKRLVHRGQSATLEHALALEQAAFGLLFSTADQREGMAAFLSKPRREPAFKGR